MYAADFVTAEDGTGIAHEAPAFGADDWELSKKVNLPFVQHVTMDGTMKPEVTAFAGMEVKPRSDDDAVRLGTDIAVLKYLQEHGALFAKENITHAYPHCWRCDTPLLNYATSSWFVAVTKIKGDLLKNAKNISWSPAHIKEGRWGDWLSGARDWSISRQRFWASVIPIWKDAKGNLTVVGSVDELRKYAKKSGNTYFVMRHGEADSNIAHVNSMHLSTESGHHLTTEGREHVAKSARQMERPDVIVASPLTRTRETAQIIADVQGLPKDMIVFDDRLREIDTGVLDGRPVSEYAAFFSNDEERFVKAPQGGDARRCSKAYRRFLI